MSRNGGPSAAFDQSILDVLRIAFRITWRTPRLAVYAVRMLRNQLAAAKRRERNQKPGVVVPPFVIFSVTGRCNLACDGCYANRLHRSDDELSDERVGEVLGEARDAGVSVMLLAGGEPLMRSRMIEMARSVPEILFLLFTNGWLLDREVARELRGAPNIIPVVSQEGGDCHTDERRGQGTAEAVSGAMERLKGVGAFFGTSMTLTSENVETATSEATIRGLMRRGCKLFYFINYVPVEPGTESLQLSQDQVTMLERRLVEYRKRIPALFIAFPHDEVALGGCLAAGRGFVHIDPRGDVQPCPFSPFADRNLTAMSFVDAMGSPLLERIRSSDLVLDETDGRCALWKRRGWVEKLASQEGTRRGNP